MVRRGHRRVLRRRLPQLAAAPAGVPSSRPGIHRKVDMIALLWTALVLVAVVAGGAFALVLILARRLKAVQERINLFLPVSEGHLPDPGTPVPAFSAVAVDGSSVGPADLAGADRIMAFLTTDCSSCHDQVPALRDLDQAVWGRPLVVIIGDPAARSEMVAALAEHATVVEEEDRGRIATAFDIHEFPAVMSVGIGVIHTAAHGLAKVLEKVAQPA